MERKYALGLIKDKEDKRDFLYKAHRGRNPMSTNRKNIKLSPYIYDQYDIGSCVGNGVVKQFRHVLKVNGQPDFDASRLFAYWIARTDKLNDTGASIRDAFKAMNRYGLCSEKLHPYITKNFANTPSEEAFKEALDHQTIRYERIPQSKFAIQDAVSKGYPVVYGKLLYESFMSDQVARTGIVPVPNIRNEECYGGHCMVIFDYESFGTVEPNSWGRGWGDKGIATVPWEYVLNPELCFDFWVLHLSE